MTQPFDLLVFIGRFQPVHIGHLEVIETALKKSNHVAVLVGSSNQPQTSKNPWTFTQRSDMIMESLAALDPKYCSRVIIKPLRDQKYNDQKWATSVQEHVEEALDQIVMQIGITRHENIKKMRIGIIGHSKDESSYYLKMFPQWDLVEHAMNENVSATDLRRLVFEEKSMKFLSGVLSHHVYEVLEAFRKTNEFTLLKREYDMIKAYKKSWEVAPYPPTFVTTDAVVVQSGHILLIERGAAPGEGLVAMPGGFLNRDEWIEEGMLRELREETKLKVPTPVLKGSIKHRAVYDRPDRSLRGRTITHAFLIVLPPGDLPLVKGSDDARKAFWLPLSDLNEEQCFEDHYHIIQDMIGKL
jgi:bifunctional NMN adenylyltransferase/nudix hydrolase